MSDQFEIVIDGNLLEETFSSMDEANAFAANKRRAPGQKIEVKLAGSFAAKRDGKPLPQRTPVVADEAKPVLTGKSEYVPAKFDSSRK